jgi:hypothetical protein
MPSEAQLKAHMQAAIAKKKQAAKPAVVTNDLPAVPPTTNHKPTHKSSPKKESVPPALSETAVNPEPTLPKPKRKHSSGAEPSDAEWTRTFFGRPVRIAVLNKDIYFSVPDVLEMTNTLEKQTKYTDLLNDPDTKKLIAPLVRPILFPNPNSGNEGQDAATAADLITIITELKLEFPGTIEKWLMETSDSLKVLIS